MSRDDGTGRLRFLRNLILAVLLIGSAWAQQPQSPAAERVTGPAGASQSAAASAGAKDGDSSEKKAAQSKPGKNETKITPEQAKELFRDVDTILKFASNDTSLPIKREVKRRLITREEVVAYLKKNMAEDKDVRRLRRTEFVLKKFGLLPKDFDLQTFLVGLLEEQVAGYYDAKTKTVNLLDWVAPDLQRPVLAHELTHALQDQSFGLDKWLKRGQEDLDTKRNLTPDDFTKDEDSEARQAVVEGQAMVVLLDYMLAPLHRTVANSPEVVDALSSDMANGGVDSVQYRNAPIFLKESLTFPYRYGLEFEAEVLRAGGKEKAFVTTFQNPPRTSREIMEPQTYISGEQVAPLPLPNFKKIFEGYDRFDVGAIGEFDVFVLSEQYAGEKDARRIYPNWRGGYYYSVRPKGNPSGTLGMVFVSRWANPKAAAQFAAIYARGIQQRYKNAESPADSKLPVDLKTLQSLSGDHSWTTSDGAIVVDVKGETVLVTESLSASITGEFRHDVLDNGIGGKGAN
jgi:hypothetical protein